MTTLPERLVETKHRAQYPGHGRWQWVLGRNVYEALLTAKDVQGHYLMSAQSQTVMGLPFRIVEQRDVMQLEELP